MYISATTGAINAIQTRAMTTSHNIANMSTPNYTAKRAEQFTENNIPKVHISDSLQPIDLVKEMTDSIQTSYDFKANLSLFKAQDELIGTTINLIG